MNFVCVCGYEERIENEPYISGHLSQCIEYANSSPLGRIIQRLKALDDIQIRVLRIDLQLALRNINNEIDQRSLSQYECMSPHQKGLQQKLPCEKCRKLFKEQEMDKIWYLEDCCHVICRQCLKLIVERDFLLKEGKLICPEISCGSLIKQDDILQVLTREEFNILDERLAMKNQNIVECFKCRSRFSFEKGQPHDVINDVNGQRITGVQLTCYNENRFVCKDCKTEQCMSCLKTPFHTGMTCEESKSNSVAQKCRLCETVIKNPQQGMPPHLRDICDQKECVERSKVLCSKSLGCGHFCQGYINEQQCLPCLECSNSPNLDDYCQVCYTEALRSAACIRSTCNHIYHYECVIRRLETRWNGPRMTFNYLNCPLCKVEMNFPPYLKDLNDIIKKNQNLKNNVVALSLERLEMEGKQNDKELKDPNNPFFGLSVDYSLAIFCFYECFKCKNPYFGGLKSCQNNMDDQERRFNKEDLICADCCPISFENKCKTHGTKYIEFKCRYCCSPAVWNLSGSTHFCDPCHMMAGRNVVKPCQGAATCPLRINHAPNGQENALGCAVCRQKRLDEKK